MGTYDKVVDIIANLTELENVGELLREKDDLSIFDINSLRFIRLIIELENEFGLEFDDEDLDYIKYPSVQSVCDYIERRLDGGM